MALRLLTRTLFCLLIVAAFAYIEQPAPVQAASINVNDTCSLPHAIIAANTDTATSGCPAGDGADTITLYRSVDLFSSRFCAEFGCSKGTAFPGGLTITSDITIEGRGYTIRNGPQHARRHRRLFHVRSGGKLTVKYAYLLEAQYTGEWLSVDEVGGAIRNEGELTIKNCYVAGNHAFEGGAIYSTGKLVIRDSAFVQNEASKRGGGIYAVGGSVEITGSSFSWHESTFEGGAIYTSVPLTVTSSGFYNNNTEAEQYDGGAIFARGSRIHVGMSNFIGNQSDEGAGGAIHLDHARGNSTISDSYFRNNRAPAPYGSVHAGVGGAISIDNHSQQTAVLQITGSRFDNNSSRYYGGAVASRSMGLVVRSSSFKDNRTGHTGGAIYRSNELPAPIGLQVQNSTFYQQPRGYCRQCAWSYPLSPHRQLQHDGQLDQEFHLR